MQSRQRKVSQTTIAFVGMFFVIKIIFSENIFKIRAQLHSPDMS